MYLIFKRSSKFAAARRPHIANSSAFKTHSKVKCELNNRFKAYLAQQLECFDFSAETFDHRFRYDVADRQAAECLEIRLKFLLSDASGTINSQIQSLSKLCARLELVFPVRYYFSDYT